MTEIESDSECIHGLGPIAACTICNGREKRERAEGNVITHRFVASFDGHCGRCGAPTLAGEYLAHTADGRYLCGQCS